MKFAIIDGVRVLPKKGLRANCPICLEPVFAKPGKLISACWSHFRHSNCDPWKEGETEWHLMWKGYFPEETQEVIRESETGEKHIADVWTKNEMVIEFQNSYISFEELRAREHFYRRMFWIVNGDQNNNKWSFEISLRDVVNREKQIYSVHWSGRGKLLEKWSMAEKPVFLDFGGAFLWRIKKYNSEKRDGEVQAISKKELVEKNGGTFPVEKEIRSQP